MRKYFYWLPVMIYMGIIYYFSSKIGSEISLPTPDYIAHGAEYFGLGFLVQWAWKGWISFDVPGEQSQGQATGNWLFNAYLGVWLFCVFYGVSDEFHQGFVPGRSQSLSDLVADGT
ncbi:MAG TPA: VanZ family protein [Bacillota bacterium]|nr:VanZ family protein [Bacillota bacterium]